MSVLLSARGAIELTATSVQPRYPSAERVLMAAILEDAVSIYRKYRHHRRAPKVFFEAKRWLEIVDRRSPCSFERVCEALELDPAYVRRVLRLTARPPFLRVGDLAATTPVPKPAARACVRASAGASRAEARRRDRRHLCKSGNTDR